MLSEEIFMASRLLARLEGAARGATQAGAPEHDVSLSSDLQSSLVVKIPTFNGDLMKWRAFWELFSVSIHCNSRYANVQKFVALKSHLSGAAEKAIDGIPVSGDGYLAAVDILQKRFQRADVEKENLMKQILDAPTVHNSSDLKGMRCLIDHLSAHTRALLVLGVTTESFSNFLLPVMKDKVPERWRLDWVRQEKSSYEDFLAFLEKESLRRQQQSTPPPTSLFTELGTTATARPCDLISDHALPDHNSFQALSADCEPSADPLWADCEPSADPLWADCEPSADPLAVAEHRRLQQERKQRTRGRRLACGYVCWLCCALLVVALAAGVGVSVPLVLRLEPSAGLQQRLHTAKQILSQVPLIDGHNDLPWNIRKFVHNNLRIFNFSADLRAAEPWASSPWSHTDIGRLRRGHVGAQFWAAYVPCESQYKNAVQMALEQVDLIKRLVHQYSDYLSLALTAEERTPLVREDTAAVGSGNKAPREVLGVCYSQPIV
ncbi:uncharacterized protein LOC122374836 [Amphibalanus amphitrite]|uniref:uncharacterized protein LOC122374836 n=1 Tax=Amphibalanus amphitrite TaxID=1232801 RepID=UPI001C9087C1|nr:uncharacterized protein LOC122374836 [Amphibalanus amphitrite]